MNNPYTHYYISPHKSPFGETKIYRTQKQADNILEHQKHGIWLNLKLKKLKKPIENTAIALDLGGE